MQSLNSSEMHMNIHQRAQLQPLNFNIPIHSSFSKKIVSSTLLYQRDHMMATERINRSEGDKKLSQIKKILSKSLFSKDKKKALIQKQKLREFFCGTKFDNLPISPQTQQKKQLLNFLKIKNIEKYVKKGNKKEYKSHESYKQARLCQNAQQSYTFGRYSQGRFLNCNNEQNQKDPVDSNSLLDEKFTSLLQMNYAQQCDISLDIESKFAIKMQKKQKRQIELLQPSATQDTALIHQKLLQEENLYLRDQLIVFTGVIESERSRVQDYKTQIKSSKKINLKLTTLKSILEKQLFQREEKIYNLSNEKNQLQRENQILNEEKSLISSKFQTLLRQYYLILDKLQEFQEEKERQIQQIFEERNKEKQLLLEQMKEKEKDLFQLGELVQDLKNRLSFYQEDKKGGKDRNKANNNFQIDKVIEEDEIDEDEDEDELEMTNSICLSLAEAESLKNIIQEKQQMFQKGIESLKKINVQNEDKFQKIIQELQEKLIRIETMKNQEIEKIKKSYTAQIQQLKSINFQNNLIMSKQIIQQQERKSLLISQIKLLQEKLEQKIKEEDQQLQQLLQNCVNQLEKERNVNFILREEFSEERKANYLMRQEIEKLKRVFTKELYLIQQIQGRSFIN